MNIEIPQEVGTFQLTQQLEASFKFQQGLQKEKSMLRAWLYFKGKPYGNLTEELCVIETSHLTLRKWYGAPWLNTRFVSVATLTLSLGPSQSQSGKAYFRQVERKFQTACSFH